MYICNNCEAVFETPDTHEEHHPYGDTYAVEEWAVYPHCAENDFSLAQECSGCGEYVADLDDGLCEICYNETE